MPNKNLLELCLSPDVGGLELYMVRTAKALNESFKLVSVIAEKTQLEQYYQDSQYRYVKMPRKRSLSFSAARKLSKIIDENDIDIVHMHWTKDLPIAVLAKVMSKKKPKLVQTRHMNMTRFKDDFYHRFLYKQMDMILAVTSQVAEQVNKFIPELIRPRVEVLYIGSDKSKLLNKEEIQSYKTEIGVVDEFVIGMVGRIEEAKGQYLLIEAVEKLKESGVSVKAFFVGHAMEESYLRELEQSVKDKGLEEEIVFLGFTKNPHRFMQTCDVMVLATRCETFGLVLIEAMQMGIPVIATNKCGPLEIVEDGKNGLLFEVDDSVSLAEKIDKLFSNPQIRQSISIEGKQKVIKEFSNELQFKKLDFLLTEI